MSRRGPAAALALTLVMGASGRADAQTRVVAPEPSPAPLVLGAAVGSFAGLVGGALFGERLGWGGGDDPGLVSALVFSQVGTIVGAAAGVELASGGDVPVLPALEWSTLGAMVSLCGVLTLASTFDSVFGDGSIWIGYSAGHGLIAGTMAARSRP